MKLKKIMALAAASVFATGTLAANASANLYKPEGELDSSLSIDTGMWLIQLYNTGNPDENKPAIDRGLDVTKIASMTAYVEIVASEKATVEDYDPSVDKYGGAMIWSANGGEFGSTSADELFAKYNWPSSSFAQWWGIPEKDDTYEGRGTDQIDADGNGGEGTNTGTATWTQNLVLKYIRRFAYSLTLEVPDEYRWPTGANCYQVGFQEWGEDAYLPMKVVAYVVNDDEGKVMVAFDELGNEIDEAQLKTIVDKLSEPVVDDEGNLLSGNNVGDSTQGEESQAPSDSSDSASTGDAATTSAANTAPTTTATSSSSSGSNNTGLIIGIIAAVVVVIVVVVIIVIKKKK